ncbi:hypothetical protein [uncultured Thiodictyon sp.]|uniref:hypothetical protein n=1 Tax=uncultured Thiodictyon sp. TaxID=1846217 RepID=UPI0025EEA339|nr:hypothetical protein [uncultured Thiodictyon sp.]
MDRSPHPTPCDPQVAAFVAGLDEDALEWFEERAAIIEFDGGLTRVDAESQAHAQTLAYLAERRRRP